jgi:DNA-binding response OmpR family regulator
MTTDSSLAWPCSRLVDHHNFEDALERGEGLVSKRWLKSLIAKMPVGGVAMLKVGLHADYSSVIENEKVSCHFVPPRVDGIMETVLIVEDDPCVQKILRRLFESERYRVEVYSDGQSAMDAIRKRTPTAVILDLGLPVLSGKDVCREIRRELPHLPVVVVSARTDEFEKVVLLELGADDYVTKPFSSTELLARVRAAIRAHSAYKQSSDASDQIYFGEACVDFPRMQVSVSGSPVRLTACEFRMLDFLVQNMDRVVHRSEVLTEVLGYEGSVHTRAVDCLILKLRQKLERDPANPVHILTFRNSGYKFAP